MEPIYKLKTGAYIDLDKLYAVSEMDSFYRTFELYFQLSNQQIVINVNNTSFIVDGTPVMLSMDELELYRRQIVNDWISYKSHKK